MKRKIYAIFFTLLNVSEAVFAVNRNRGPSFGDISQNLFGAEMGVHDFIQAVCIISGAALILGAFIQFMKYRRNPIATKLSTVILNLFIGLILIGLAFVPFQL